MGFVAKVGFGYKKDPIKIGHIEYPIVEEYNEGNTKIIVKKTDDFKANGVSRVNEWRFFGYDNKNVLQGYLVGQVIKDKDNKSRKNFYLQRVQSSDLKEKLRVFALFEGLYKTGHNGLNKIFNFNIEKPKNGLNGMSNRKAIYDLFNFSKDYLKKSGFPRMITQGNMWFFDTLSFCIHAGFRDLDRNRMLEQYKNLEERKKHLSRLEKLTGLVVLEYPFNGQD
ncbi:MAG: hypothetical protein NUV46_02940 [Nanoarchaeota archaeon]|nr:hypothetical protein [Nanoarchaeota archaeon]